MSDKITLVCDTECYRNYFLAMFRNIANGKTMHFELYDGHPLDVAAIARILKRYRLVTFNGRKYDMPMLALACKGADNAKLKAASDEIILTELQPWQFEDRYTLKLPKVDHIDLIEVAPGVAVSLKLYAGRMHAQRLQDLPLGPDAEIAPEQRDDIIAYCGNDLTVTGNLFATLAPQIELRERLSAEYGQDLRSKSDAQIAEAVIRAKVAEITGERVERPLIKAGTTFYYQVPAFINYASPVMSVTLDVVRRSEFKITESGGVEMPDELLKMRVPIGGSVYRMGIGGLHSTEQSVYYVADKHHMLVDRDVASYYPQIILNCGLAPRHMGEPFLTVYRDIVTRRLEAKHAGNKVDADSLKITINGSFGKLGSMWSALYSPDLMIQVTITGQLALLMLIERLEHRGIAVVSANTDGIVIKCNRKAEASLQATIKEWEDATHFETEETRYRAIYSRDVNNYIAFKEGGGVKTKGVYAPTGLQKNPTGTICAKAVIAFLEDRVPIELTITRCRDIREFLTVRRVNGGAACANRYLGKVVRWYYGRNSEDHIEYITNGNKVAKSEGCVPMMDLIYEFPEDLDYHHYVEEAYSMLYELGVLA